MNHSKNPEPALTYQRDPAERDAVKYRPNVAAIIRRDDLKIFVGERSDTPGCWQFPQGGIKKGEHPAEALARELLEEVSLQPQNYNLIDQKGPYRYLFRNNRIKEGYHGQEQQYFLVQLAKTAVINVDTKDAEFRDFRWIHPAEFRLDWIPAFKKEVYKRVFCDFFEIQI
jgi:putative (di)nucleoside polyphosphate hydrolase